MRRLHVAVLDEELPFPHNSGKRIRTYNLLSRLAGRHRLTYLCHRNPDSREAEQAEKAMTDLGIRTVVVDRRVPPKSGLGFYARLAANLFSPLPYSVASHRSEELLAAARQLEGDDRPDLWHCEWTPYAEYLRRPLGTAPWVVMAHNVESLIWQRYFETESNPLKRWYIKQQYRKFERFEKWAYSSCATSIGVSEQDVRLIRNRYGAAKAAVVDNGVDTLHFAPDECAQRDPYRILFLGSLDWRPNVDGVRMLLDDIFPRVLEQEPRAVLQIVGRKPAESLRREVGAQPGVELHANVTDVRPFLHQSGMLAVPLRIGGGSRLKILEALAAALPVITTRVGVEGLHLESAEHVTIADAPVDIARELVRIMVDRREASEQAERGRQRVVELYDWPSLADRLESVWLDAVGRRAGSESARRFSSVVGRPS
jgi:polysaccharide biosynthesis protein PslH